ncbi:MAG: glycerol-3-phosphate acyltransferase [Anaerolineae bacterium]|nr:glycerol-3-phosphate acyltransferase [Anaerolineae bacterium]
MLLALAVAGYLLGSIPVAWLVARAVSGQDLRRVGSGNVGVLNTAVSVARWAGLLVFAAEAAKGVGAVLLARSLSSQPAAAPLALLAAVAGTRWSIWLRGAGGRGNTGSVAGILLLSWPTVAFGLLLWLVARLLTHRSFVATRVVLAAWPLIFALLSRSWWNGLAGVALSLMFVTTHRPETDDHLLVKDRWPSLWAFLSGPRRG